MIPGHLKDPELLLDGEWRPITGTVLFAHSTAAQVVNELINGVRGRFVLDRYGFPLSSREMASGPLPERLRALLPLDLVEDSRYLVMNTANPEWCAIFGSRWRSLDGHSELVWLASGGIESVLISDVPHRPNSAPPNKSYGVRKLETYELVPGADHLAHPHAVVVRATGARGWEAYIDPEHPFPVGLVWDPQAKRTQDRFRHEHLDEMARRYGLRPFDDDFYPAEGDAHLVFRTDPEAYEKATVTLEQARGIEPHPAFQ